ncbi:hypothetical protein FIBSPDRAFT_967434 [Athelia psychrophila]|uniref:Uncharacterized protein n=1 Tax=Athelia psychrophila TaxID=1759441 RepID=A0A167VQL9_9AGAM|nr:hypothetical protein FIBSPDRAFT_967434 [Fibularhizoctonia sp. CBS 109695]
MGEPVCRYASHTRCGELGFNSGMDLQVVHRGHGHIAKLVKVNPLSAVACAAIGLTQCAVQLFFAWRLHIISAIPYQSSTFSLRGFMITKQHWLTVFICICSLPTLVGYVGTGLAALLVKDYLHLASIAPIVLTSGFSTVVADVLITLAMTYHLHRAKGTFARTDRFLDHIIQHES